MCAQAGRDRDRVDTVHRLQQEAIFLDVKDENSWFVGLHSSRGVVARPCGSVVLISFLNPPVILVIAGQLYSRGAVVTFYDTSHGHTREQFPIASVADPAHAERD